MLRFKNIFNKFTFITIITFLIYACGGGSSSSTNSITNKDVDKIENDLHTGLNNAVGINKEFYAEFAKKTAGLKQNDYIDLSISKAQLEKVVGTIIDALDNHLHHYIEDESFAEMISTEAKNNDNNYYAYNTNTNMVSVDPIPTRGYHKDYKNKDGNNDIQGTRTIVYGKGAEAFKFAHKYKKVDPKKNIPIYRLQMGFTGSTIVSKFASITKGTATDYISRENQSSLMEKYCKSFKAQHSKGAGQDHSRKITYDKLHNREILGSYIIAKNNNEETQIENRSFTHLNNILTLKGTYVNSDLNVTGTTLMNIALCGYNGQDITISSAIDSLTFVPYDQTRAWNNPNVLGVHKSDIYFNIQKITISKSDKYNYTKGTKLLKIDGLLTIPQPPNHKKLRVKANLSNKDGGKIEFSDYKGSKIIAVLKHNNFNVRYSPYKIDYDSERIKYKFYTESVSTTNLIINKEFSLRLFSNYYDDY